MHEEKKTAVMLKELSEKLKKYSADEIAEIGDEVIALARKEGKDNNTVKFIRRIFIWAIQEKEGANG